MSASESRIMRRWSAVIPDGPPAAPRRALRTFLVKKSGSRENVGPCCSKRSSTNVPGLPWSPFRIPQAHSMWHPNQVRGHLPRRDEPQTLPSGSKSVPCPPWPAMMPLGLADNDDGKMPFPTFNIQKLAEVEIGRSRIGQSRKKSCLWFCSERGVLARGSGGPTGRWLQSVRKAVSIESKWVAQGGHLLARGSPPGWSCCVAKVAVLAGLLRVGASAVSGEGASRAAVGDPLAGGEVRVGRVSWGRGGGSPPFRR